MVSAKVLDMNGNEFTPQVFTTEKKLTKSGEIKQTPNNNSCDRWVDPIRNKEDIEKVKTYLMSKVNVTNSISYKQAYGRNYALFVCGINFGIRISDLLELKWNNIFAPDMETFRDRCAINEIKTGKVRQLYFNQSVKDVITWYIAEFQIDIQKDCYIFINSKRDKDGTFHVITDECVSKFIKEAAIECKLKGNYNTHSMRKTYAYQMYMMLVSQNDPLALAKVQKFLNHRNQSDTLRYLGLQFKMEGDINNQLCL